MSREVAGLAPVKGRLRGGPVRTSELEVHSMLLAGMIHTLSYLADVSDMVNVSICSRCRRLSLLCDCDVELPAPSITIRVRHSVVKFDIFRAVYSLNGTIGDSTQLYNYENESAGLPAYAESFVYDV
jgi:hypothetical protein